MSIPKEPRQRMINMMYLVLTALLALNISAEILNAFYLVNDGINDAITASDFKNNLTYAQILRQKELDEGKAGDIYDASIQAKTLADDLVLYIDDMMNVMIEESGGWNKKHPEKLEQPKNLDKPSRIMINQGNGDELQKRVNGDRQKFLDILAAFNKDGVNTRINIESFSQQLSLKADDPPVTGEKGNRTWAQKNFEMVPVVAAMTIFTSLKNDVRNAEADVVNRLYQLIGGEDFKFDNLRARVIAPTSYITLGQMYTADIFVSASNSTTDNVVYVGDFDETKLKRDSAGILPLELDDNPMMAGYDTLRNVGGMGKLEESPSAEGIQQFQGVIVVLNTSTGQSKYYPFEQEYQAAKPFAVVSPTKMNVLYIGLPNPLAISVPGFPDERITASITGGGSLRKLGRGQYEAMVRSRGTVKVVVSAELKDGSRKPMGDPEFRVKRIPNPVPEVGEKQGGNITAAKMRVQRGMIAKLYNFDFEARFNVVSFKLIYRPRGSGDAFPAQVTGPVFTGRMKDFIVKARSGDFYFFKDIKVRGPDGTTRELASISFEII